MKYSYKNILIFILFILFLIGIVMFNSYTKKEGFFAERVSNGWTPDLLDRFVQYQRTVNKNVNQYNLKLLQQQATPKEAEQLLETGYWPWPDYLKEEYIKAIWSSTIVKIQPQYALDYAMKIYNKRAAEELLAWNTKEGNFLLYGGNLGVSDNMPKDINNTIKCSTDANGNSIMEKTVYTGKNLWNGFFNSNVTNVEPQDIPSEMPGFSFIDKPCNPCLLDDFNCPFKLNVKGDDTTSVVWSKLWNL
jgi:hypothetical protein